MEDKKKSKKGIVFIIILLILIILGLVGYICYDKGIIDFGMKQESVPIEKKSQTKEVKLDVNSRLVQTLYSNVTSPYLNSCNKNAIYGDKDEFVTAKATESEKAVLVGNLLSESGEDYVDCNKSNFEDVVTMKVGGNDWPLYSSCKLNKMYSNRNEGESAYSKDTINRYYRMLFGQNAKINTSLNIPLDPFYGRVYHYVTSLDKYVLYSADGIGGGTCGPIKYEDNIEKATIKGKILKIYEKEVVTTTEEGPDGVFDTKDDKESKESTNYVYTFERETDGMYKFISRLKESS